MIGCVVSWVGIAGLFWMYKKGKLPIEIKGREARYFFLVLIVSNLAATVLFGVQILNGISESEITRNTYGGGEKIEDFEVTLEGELREEAFQVEVGEQEYSYQETLSMFEEIMSKLDKVVLGENKSFDRVEHDLNLAVYLNDYPVEIRWEMSRYDVIDVEGKILEDYDNEEGELVELRGTVYYAEEMAVYTANAMIFPEAASEKEKWMKKIKELIQSEEKKTREDEVFVLPSSIDGKKIEWRKAEESTGYYIMLLGIVTAIFIPFKKIQDEREQKKKRQEQMLRDYPEMISKFTLLLSTGMTLKAVWIKIIQTYEETKNQTGKREVYEEMCFAYREMQGGIPEKDAYERFGQRCGLISYMKLGALLSQNIKKGSKGLAELLALESIQAFEERKSSARKLGEEAGTKLMVPMFAMLAVVLVMVVVPAFLSMQI